MVDGILVGCDVQQEWLLPWWWENYTTFNAFPVAFADFGMTPEALSWCEKHGKVVTSTPANLQVAEKTSLNPERVEIWEGMYDHKVWEIRKIWFQKPFAMLNSPFARTIWIDLDCEILGSVGPLFDKCQNSAGLAMAQEVERAQQVWRAQQQAFEKEMIYNSGVVVFAKDSPLIPLWAQHALTDSNQCMGDQDVVNRVIYTHGFQITEIDQIYNWRLSQGLNLNAVIIHWVRSGGKEYIRKYGGVGNEIRAFIQSLSKM